MIHSCLELNACSVCLLYLFIFYIVINKFVNSNTMQQYFIYSLEQTIMYEYLSFEFDSD